MNRKLMVLVVLVVSGGSLAETTGHDHLARTPLWKYQVYGKVKSIRTCGADGKSCHVQQFNIHGVPLDQLQAREVLKQKGDTVVLQQSRAQGPGAGGKTLETYVRGKIVLLEVLDRKDQWTVKNVYSYGKEGQLQKRVQYNNGQEEVAEVEEYWYSESKPLKVVHRMYMTEDMFMETQTLYNKAGFPEKITVGMGPDTHTDTLKYELDHRGNWIKQYVNGKVQAIRSIGYH